MEIIGFISSFRKPIMENVGFTKISNNSRDCPNDGSGLWGFSKIMEIVGFTNIFREVIIENIGFTNIFHDFPNWYSGSRGFSKFMEIVGILGFINIFCELIMKNVSFLNNFHEFEFMALTHEVSRNIWKFLELLVLPIFSVNQSWKLLVLPTLSIISRVFAFGRNPKKLLMFIMLTRATSNNPTGAHDARPKSAMNTAYVLMFAT